jgi:GAF domain-containing protein
MVDSTGHTLGSLCLIDYEPREFSEDELADLRRFADEAVEQLELRRELIAAREGER